MAKEQVFEIVEFHWDESKLAFGSLGSWVEHGVAAKNIKEADVTKTVQRLEQGKDPKQVSFRIYEQGGK